MIMNSHRFRFRIWYHLFLGMTILASALVGPASFTTSANAEALAIPPAAPTNHLTLSVVDASNSSAIGEYKYLINVDNTGDPFQPRNAGCSPDDPG